MMNLAGRLLEPIVLSWGYCITWGFEARLLAVLFNQIK
jgi:hypothetical protein